MAEGRAGTGQGRRVSAGGTAPDPQPPAERLRSRGPGPSCSCPPDTAQHGAGPRLFPADSDDAPPCSERAVTYVWMRAAPWGFRAALKTAWSQAWP